MSGRRLILWFSQTAVIVLALATLFVGCSRQGEGERCDKEAAGDTDCDTGLKCIECERLARGAVDRCCPEDSSAHTKGECDRADTDRVGGECAPATGGTGSGTGGRAGASGAGGSGAMSGSGGSTATGGSGAVSGEGGAGDAGGVSGQ